MLGNRRGGRGIIIGSNDDDKNSTFYTAVGEDANSGRVAAMPVTNDRMIAVDLSRQRLTTDTLNHLLRLASARDVRGLVGTLAWGRNDRLDPVRVRRNETLVRLDDDEGSCGIVGGEDNRVDVPLSSLRMDHTTLHNMRRPGYDNNTNYIESPKRTRFFSNIAQPPSYSSSKNRDGYRNHRNSNIVGSTANHNTIMTRPDPRKTSPIMHLALRTPCNAGLTMLLPPPLPSPSTPPPPPFLVNHSNHTQNHNNSHNNNNINNNSNEPINALDGIHENWIRISKLSQAIRDGRLRGATGKRLRDVVVVGCGSGRGGRGAGGGGGGTSIMESLRFLHRALRTNSFAGAALAANPTPKESKLSDRPLLKGGGGNENSSPSKSWRKGGNHQQHGDDGGIDGGNMGNGGGAAGGAGGFSSRARELRIIDDPDPDAVASGLRGLKPAETILVTLEPDLGCRDRMRRKKSREPMSPTPLPNFLKHLEDEDDDEAGWEDEEEDVDVIAAMVRNWLVRGTASGVGLGSHAKRPDLVLSKHVFTVTGNSAGLGATDTAIAGAGSDKSLSSSKHPSPWRSNDNTFIVPPHLRSDAFPTFTSAGLLPLSLAYGWDVVCEMIAGAHDMDEHFVSANPRHNIPILLALADVWNDAFLRGGRGGAYGGTSQSMMGGGEVENWGYEGGGIGRIVLPFAESMGGYAAFCASVESLTTTISTQGKGGGGSGRRGLVIDGGSGGRYDRLVRMGGMVGGAGGAPPTEVLSVLEPNVPAAGEALMLGGGGIVPGVGVDVASSRRDLRVCAALAHVDGLAFGPIAATGESAGGSVTGGSTVVTTATAEGASSPSSFVGSPLRLTRTISFEGRVNRDNDDKDSNGIDAEDITSAIARATSSFPRRQSSGGGNQPSTVIFLSKCDAFACGQLVALAEHRAVVGARLWGDGDPLSLGVREWEWEEENGEERHRSGNDSNRAGRGSVDTVASSNAARVTSLMERLGEMRTGMEDGNEDDDNEGVGMGVCEGDESGNLRLNLATSTILRHYANTRR